MEDEAVLTSRLQRAWLQQLAREHAQVCGQYGLPLSPPVFELVGGQGKRLASWHPQGRLMRFSQELLLHRSWAVVQEILKHELAHQIVSEWWHCQESGHGPRFQEACQLLGILAPFRSASCELDGAEGQVGAEDGDMAVLRRVRKLLALGQSDNVHEAARAMEHASRLLARHNLELPGAPGEEQFTHLVLETGRQRLPAWQRLICSLLQAHFQVQVVVAETYQVRSDRLEKSIQLLGRSSSVAVGEHCYGFLLERLDNAWARERLGQGRSRLRQRNSFYLGMVKGFADQLADRASDRHRDAGQALAVTTGQDAALARFVEGRFPRLVRRSGRRLMVDSQAYSAGTEAGRRLRLDKAVATGRQRLLP